jgi:leader peptidase (prepilin peptidase) / N-methyltransferase
MQKHELLMLGLLAIWLLFVFAAGACIGSLTNVIVYRMPKGISVIWPPSRCPSCNTKLSWRDNIPILGWLFLRGRCRYCKGKISPEYPLVELSVALLFALFFVVWYMLPPGATAWGVNWGAMVPYWAANPPAQTWPTFVVVLTLLGSLVAMTLVDAKTFTIPLPIMWAPAIVALVVHPLHAKIVGGLPGRAGEWLWAIPTPGFRDWPMIWASIGAVVGLGISILLLKSGLIRASFEDYPEWEAAHTAASRDLVLEAPAAGEPSASAPAPQAVPGQGSPEHWMDYPHARREMIRELAFLAPCLGLALAGWYFGQWWGAPWKPHPLSGTLYPSVVAPLWLLVLSGVLQGYLVGGGVVWAVRILGSLGFGREAMGLGDVHLMAAIGACLGWVNSTLAFFGAAFVGLAWALVSAVSRGKLRRMMPYGPFLAVSTVLVLLGRPLIEQFLSALFRVSIQLPP